MGGDASQIIHDGYVGNPVASKDRILLRFTASLSFIPISADLNNCASARTRQGTMKKGANDGRVQVSARSVGDVCCLFAPSSLFVTISVSLLVSSSHCVSLALTLCFSHTVCLPLTICLFLSSLAFGSFYQQTPRPPLQTHAHSEGRRVPERAIGSMDCWEGGGY